MNCLYKFRALRSAEQALLLRDLEIVGATSQSRFSRFGEAGSKPSFCHLHVGARYVLPFSSLAKQSLVWVWALNPKS